MLNQVQLGKRSVVYIETSDEDNIVELKNAIDHYLPPQKDNKKSEYKILSKNGEIMIEEGKRVESAALDDMGVISLLGKDIMPSEKASSPIVVGMSTTSSSTANQKAFTFRGVMATDSNEEITIPNVKPQTGDPHSFIETVQRLTNMGFTSQDSALALRQNKYDVPKAIEFLMNKYKSIPPLKIESEKNYINRIDTIYNNYSSELKAFIDRCSNGENRVDAIAALESSNFDTNNAQYLL